MFKAMIAPSFTRHVLFLPGFDPSPARAHRERYRHEGAEQARISGYELSISPDPGGQKSAWRVQAIHDGQACDTRMEVLVWSDIVAAAMPRQGDRIYRKFWSTARVYMGSGALRQIARLRKGPVIAALYPVAILLAQGLLAVLLGALLAWGAYRLGADLVGAHWWLFLMAVPVFDITRRLVLSVFAGRGDKLLARYLMQDYAYAASEGGAYPAGLSDRLAMFTDRLRQVARTTPDEILLIGHSSGAYLAVSVLADALRAGRLPKTQKISLLTLGHVIPMVSFLPRAHRLRADLAALASSDQITWVDVSAPGDGCSFALCDPVAVSSVAPDPQRWPLVISAAFTRTMSPARQQALRWRFFRLHFQYMCAFDRPGDYDFFAITSGPHTLSARFAGRSPSPGRITTPVNPNAGITS